jgi:outer membrane lipoprotein LolB
MKGFAAAAIVAAVLGGCAAVTLAPRDSQPFDLLGRILVTYSGGALTANLRWLHDSSEDQIWLMTPTGQTLAYIVDSPQGATLTRADQREYRASSVEALTRQALGWPLPLSFLQYWVQGRPAPGAAANAVEREADGRFVAFTQNGWHVAITYYSEGEFKARVRRLDVSDGASEIRLVIDTWRNDS